MEMIWTSIYIYLTINKVEFLKNCIIPEIENALAENLIESFFYIYYFENGSHIRLRLKHDKTKNIYVYFKKQIDCYLKNLKHLDAQLSSNWEQNNVILVPYEPEIARYGGNFGITIAETFFKNSSELCFSYIKKGQLDTYNSVLNASIKSHIVSIYTYCNGDIQNAIILLNCIYIGRYNVYFDPFLDYNVNRELIFHKYFVEQKDMMIAYVSRLWNALADHSLHDDILLKWKNDENYIKSQLEDGYKNNNIFPSYTFEKFPLWSIYQSFIHMNNNRLGVKPIDESLIAYLIMESLKRLNL